MEIIRKLQENPVMRFRVILLMLLDIICVFASGYMALAIRFDLNSLAIDEIFLESYLKYTPVHMITIVVLYVAFHIYQSLWEYAGYQECMNIVAACSAAAVLQIIGFYCLQLPIPRSYYIISNGILAILTMTLRLGYRMLRIRFQKQNGQNGLQAVAQRTVKRVMIAGGGQACIMLMKEIRNSGYLNRQVCCIIDDDPQKLGRYIQNVRIVGNRTMIPQAAEQYKIEQIIIAMPSAKHSEVKQVLEICQKTGCELLILPGIYQIVKGDVSMSQLRKVEIEDLLGREPVKLDTESIIGYVTGKTILVTGGGGSIGSELCRQLADHPIKRLVIVEIYENNAYDIQQELKRKHPGLDLQVRIASVRDYHRMNEIFSEIHPDIIYHAAAHKHVPLMEDSPNEAIKNNVGGTWNMVRLADQWQVQRFVLISTDKAVNPTNVMGASKRICEMIIQTYNSHSKTEYVAVRFGNVLGSNGSVIPLFKQQIAEGGPVTVTHPDVIRYFMLIPEAVSLVLQAGAYARGGEIFVLDMGDPVRIYELAYKMISLAGLKPGEDIKIKITGLRPGEKLYEELLMDEEGMQETPNKMIHIGRPIRMDEKCFFPQLEKLLEKAYEDSEDIRGMIQEIVDTYVIQEEAS